MKSGSTSGPDRGFAARTALLLAAASTMVLNLVLIYFWVPTEQVMGVVQRGMYFHVPLAYVAFLAFFIVLAGSVMYLWKGSEKWDALAHSSAEVGVLFTTLVLVTGAIWAKPVWGVWWTWDPRLTTSTILWLMYIAYLMLRAYAPSPQQGARYAAVMGIVAFVNVPIVYYATILWRNVHPGMVVGPAAESGSLDPTMRSALLFSTLTFTLLFAYLVSERLAIRRAFDSLVSVRYQERTA